MRSRSASNAANTAVKRLESMLLYDKHDISAVFAETMKEDMAVIAGEYLPVSAQESEVYIEKDGKNGSPGVLVCRFRLLK